MISGGKEVRFVADFGQAKVLEARERWATASASKSRLMNWPPAAGSNLQRVLTLEAYDDFPNILLSSVYYKNAGTSEV